MSSQNTHPARKLARSAVKFGAGAVIAFATVKVGWWTLRAVGKVLGVVPPPQQTRDPAHRLHQEVDEASEDKWAVQEALPPACPASFKQIASIDLPCSVQEFYYAVVGGNSDYFAQHSRSEGQWDLSISGWKPVPQTAEPPPVQAAHLPGPGGYTRTMRFVQPKKPPSSVDSQCVQQQSFGVYQGEVLVFATSMHMLNIPFKDCFHVNTWWEVKPSADSPTACTVTIYLRVHFVKSCIVGGIISRTTFRDSTPAYKTFLENAKILITSAPPGSFKGPQAGRRFGLRSMGSGNLGAGGAARSAGAKTSGQSTIQAPTYALAGLVVVLALALSVWQLLLLYDIRGLTDLHHLASLQSLAWASTQPPTQQ